MLLYPKIKNGRDKSILLHIVQEGEKPMKKNITYHENTTFITVDFDINEKVNALVADGTTLFDAVEMVNSITKNLAVAEIVTADGIKWDKLVYGVIYPVATLDDGQLTEENSFKAVKVSDCFILRANKNSEKTVIPSKLLTLVKAFGVNITESKYSDIADDTLPKLISYAKFNNIYDCFTCETKTSINQLEKQFAIFLEYFFGKDNAPQARKTYVKHLKEQYIKAVTDGYRNGNEIALLQLIINHAYDNATRKEYTIKSGLDAHRKPKEKNA